jgi:hypothetical protein
MKKLSILFLLLASSPIFAQDSKQTQRQETVYPLDFVQVLQRAQMIFDLPKDFSETKVIVNEDLSYIYAVKSPDKKMEVRYVIWPLDSQIAKYNRPHNDGETMIEPNSIYAKLTFMHMVNISSEPMDQIQEILPFDSATVKGEFGADWGGTASVLLRKTFGGKYEWCSVIALHKDKVADAWCFFLAKNKEDLLSHWDPAFFSLRFK